MDVWVGTSGYSYSDWVGGFYPAGTRRRRCSLITAGSSRSSNLISPFTVRQLRICSTSSCRGRRRASSSSSSCRAPSATKTAADDIDGFRRAVLKLQKQDRLSGLLLQLPQSRTTTAPSRAWIKTVGKRLGDLNLAVEFRHRSWAGPETVAWLADLGLAIVAVDVPDLPGLYPRGWVQSGPVAYVRFHSRNPATGIAPTRTATITTTTTRP